MTKTPLKEISLQEHILHDKLTGFFGKPLCEGFRKRAGVTDEYRLQLRFQPKSTLLLKFCPLTVINYTIFHINTPRQTHFPFKHCMPVVIDLLRAKSSPVIHNTHCQKQTCWNLRFKPFSLCKTVGATVCFKHFSRVSSKS